MRSLHHFQGHINHLQSEISLRASDTLRVAYPQSVLTTYAGLNPDITCTVVFLGAPEINGNNETNLEMNFGRYTSFHQVHIARPVFRAQVSVEVEVQAVPNGTPAAAMRPRMPAGFDQAGPRVIRVNHTQHFGRTMPSTAPYFNPQNIRPMRAAFLPTHGTGVPFARRPNIRPPPAFVRAMRPRMVTRVQRIPFANTGNNAASPSIPFAGTGNNTSSPNIRLAGAAATESNNSNGSGVGRTLRNILQSMTGHPVGLEAQGSPTVTLSSNDLLNPLNSIFRAVDPNASTTSNENQSIPTEDGPADVSSSRNNSTIDSSSESDNDDIVRMLQSMAEQQTAYNHIRTADEPRKRTLVTFFL